MKDDPMISGAWVRAALGIAALAGTLACPLPARAQLANERISASCDDVGAAPTAIELRLGVDRLAFMRGDWRGAVHSPTPDGGWEEVGQSSFSVTPDMNGLYLVTQVPTGQYLYAIVFSYDVAQGRYRIVSRADQSGLIDVYQGGFDSSGVLIVDNLESGTHYRAGGSRIHNRMAFVASPNGGWTWLVEASADGGETWRPQIRFVARSDDRPSSPGARAN